MVRYLIQDPGTEDPQYTYEIQGSISCPETYFDRETGKFVSTFRTAHGSSSPPPPPTEREIAEQEVDSWFGLAPGEFQARYTAERLRSKPSFLRSMGLSFCRFFGFTKPNYRWKETNENH